MHFLASNPVFESFFESDAFGKGIFLGLLLLSIVTWTILVNKGLYISHLKKTSKKMQENFKLYEDNPLGCDLLPRNHPFSETYRLVKRKAVELLQKNHSALGKEAERSYLFSSDIEFLEAHMATTMSKEMESLEKNLFLLSTTVTLAPFLGLLGTVWGILLTFVQLNSSLFAEKSALIMGGLSMALGTTIVGLVVAIPALVGYNYLKNALIQFESSLDAFGTVLLAQVELHYRKVEMKYSDSEV